VPDRPAIVCVPQLGDGAARIEQSRLLVGQGQAEARIQPRVAVVSIVLVGGFALFGAMFYIVVLGATGDSFARVGPYQSEDDARRAAGFSKLKHYQIEEASFRAEWPPHSEHLPQPIARVVSGGRRG
jgi:hypothetical protein